LTAASISTIASGGITLAYVIRSGPGPDRTEFVTPDDATLQVGFVVYPAGGEVVRHRHLPITRSIVGTSEVLLVREGRCEADLYDQDQRLVSTVELEAGDVIVLIAGGHGFRMTEDTVLIEVKQGPYVGESEKERF
jgi:hypothetical protein